MAKKAVGKIKTHKKQAMAKVILPVRKATSSVYTYQETMMPAEAVQDFLASNTP